MPSEPGYIGGGMFQRDPDVATPSSSWPSTTSTPRWPRWRRTAERPLASKEPVGDMGFAAYFNDSEGNLMGLWQSAT